MDDRVSDDVAEDCLTAAREALPELAQLFADRETATVPWMLTIHAGGGWQIIQGGGALVMVHQPSVGVAVKPGASAEQIAANLERAWLADDRMAEHRAQYGRDYEDQV